MDFADKSFERRSFEPGETIFHLGARATDAFVVLNGEVEIVGTNDLSEQVVLTIVRPGEMFGELALLQADAKRTAKAITHTGCELMTVSRDKVLEKIDEADPFVRYWLQYLSKRVVDLSKRVHK